MSRASPGAERRPRGASRDRPWRFAEVLAASANSRVATARTAARHRSCRDSPRRRASDEDGQRRTRFVVPVVEWRGTGVESIAYSRRRCSRASRPARCASRSRSSSSSSYAPIVLGGKTWDDVRVSHRGRATAARRRRCGVARRAAHVVGRQRARRAAARRAESRRGVSARRGSPRRRACSTSSCSSHIWWCALGIALWARRLGASELGGWSRACSSRRPASSRAVRCAARCRRGVAAVDRLCRDVARCAVPRGARGGRSCSRCSIAAVALAGQLAVLVARARCRDCSQRSTAEIAEATTLRRG